MEERPLGGSGIAVSRVILGCGNFGGIGSAPAFFGQGESEGGGVRDHGRRLGGRASRPFDTADAYGGGRSEALDRRVAAREGAGRARPDRSRPRSFNPTDGDADDTGSRARPDPAPARREPRAARRRARRPVPGARAGPGHAARGDARGVRRARRDDGHDRRRRGVATSTPPSARGSRSRTAAPRACVQNSYSLLDRGDEGTCFRSAREHGIGYAPFSPLAGGWLTGKYRRGEALPAGLADDAAARAVRALRRPTVFDALEALEAEARERGVDRPPTLALAWLLGQPQVDARSWSARRAPEHLEPALRGARSSTSRRPSATGSERFFP